MERQQEHLDVKSSIQARIQCSIANLFRYYSQLDGPDWSQAYQAMFRIECRTCSYPLEFSLFRKVRQSSDRSARFHLPHRGRLSNK